MYFISRFGKVSASKPNWTFLFAYEFFDLFMPYLAASSSSVSLLLWDLSKSKFFFNLQIFMIKIDDQGCFFPIRRTADPGS